MKITPNTPIPHGHTAGDLSQRPACRLVCCSGSTAVDCVGKSCSPQAPEKCAHPATG
ncbi:unnamed protein product [Ectocarpus sp. CCAP 1310/34]|nr:unnamed protein product [Ectocarpus sp. CCAP 1310/34]